MFKMIVVIIFFVFTLLRIGFGTYNVKEYKLFEMREDTNSQPGQNPRKQRFVVKVSRGSAISYYMIPDIFTAIAILNEIELKYGCEIIDNPHTIEGCPTLEQQEFNRIDSSTPSLISNNTPDDNTLKFIQLIELMSKIPVKEYWLKEFTLQEPYLFGVSLGFFNGHLLAILGSSNPSALSHACLSWFKEEDENRFHENSVNVPLIALELNRNRTMFGINGSTCIDAKVDDPRMHMMSNTIENDRLTLSFMRPLLAGRCLYLTSQISMQNSKNIAVMGPIELIQTPAGYKQLMEKNFMRIYDNNQIYYIWKVHPYTLLEEKEIISWFEDNVTFNLLHEWGDSPEAKVLKVLQLAYTATLNYLPWKAAVYGELHGGTDPVLVSDPSRHDTKIYLTFLHSKVNVPGNPANLKSYLMGAMALCPTFPFHIHAMSRYPIIKRELFDGPWEGGARDYIMYPLSLMLDPNNVSNVWLTFNANYHRAHFVQMEIEGLLKSMDRIRACD